MSIEHRPDPNNFAGAEARRQSYKERAKRLARDSDKSFPRLLLGVAVKLAVLFAAASLAIWLLSLVRGY